MELILCKIYRNSSLRDGSTHVCGTSCPHSLPPVS